jgi:myo-inositol-1(or 4)-monophosphatase
MDTLYTEIIEYVITSGKRLVRKAGKIKDIGIRKKYLTEEDIRIEKELKKIIHHYDPQHGFFAEEQNDIFINKENVWVVDPISGTRAFIKGLPHYGIVVSHIWNQKIMFALIFDPSVNELFTAYHDRGAYLNNSKIKILNRRHQNLRIIFQFSDIWKDDSVVKKIFSVLSNFDLSRNYNSHAVNYCHVACGRYDGVISLTKDSFTEFAGSLIVKEGGGIFTNLYGNETINPADRVFIAGENATYKKLKKAIEKVFHFKSSISKTGVQKDASLSKKRTLKSQKIH